MSKHTSSTFNNHCVKLPINPKTHHPFPLYEQKFLNNLRNETVKTMKPSKDSIQSYMEFFDSIPEYNELNHLTNKEFYKKIEWLKEKQKTYTNFYHDGKTREDKNITPILISRKRLDDESSVSDRVSLKPSSRRSVRIETPVCNESKKESPIIQPEIWDNFSISELEHSKSAPNSPSRTKSENGITIPKPFEMTIKDEENQILDEILATNKTKETKNEMFRAHPVPIESQIPLFDAIMANQERKNHIVRERSKALLLAQMRPFSFTKREEEIQKLTKGLSKSSPSLFLNDPPLKIKKFKAKPIPKNLFSNYIYQKMHEDEFYRALQRKIRAEELLRAASLPPSMAKREQNCVKYNVCPRSYRDLEKSESEELKDDFLKTKKAKIRKKKKKYREYSASSTESRTTPSSFSLQAINRSNLAALLRIQTARKKLELEMCTRLEEAKLKEEALWREKLMRKKPVWQALAYSHEEDLAMRLQLRRDEERLRREEHKLRMELMLGRVNQQPTLFERQSKVQYPATKQELLDQLYSEYKVRRDKKNSEDDYKEESDSDERSKESENV